MERDGRGRSVTRPCRDGCPYVIPAMGRCSSTQSVRAVPRILPKTFLYKGTLWTRIEHVIETPMFVDSQMTSMVQLADLCAYAIRRYLENPETQPLDSDRDLQEVKRGSRIKEANYVLSGFIPEWLNCR